MNSNLAGSIGDGRIVCMLDNEHYGCISGNIITIHHISRGPKDYITINDGISTICSYLKTQLIAIATLMNTTHVDVMEFTTQKIKTKLPNPSNSVIISLSYTFEGDRLIGLSDKTNPMVIGWSVSSESVLFSTKLDNNFIYSSCYANPCDVNSFSVYGDGFISFGKSNETLGTFTVECLQAQAVTNTDLPFLNFLTWLPSNVALLNDYDGNLYLFNIIEKSCVNIGMITSPTNEKLSFIPTCALITLESLILGSTSGEIVWVNINLANMIKLPAGTPMSKVIMIDSISQFMKLSQSIEQILPIDKDFEASIVKISDASLLHVPLKLVQSVTASGEMDDMNGSYTGNNPVMLPTTIVTPLSENTATPVIATCSCAIPMIKSENDDTYLNCFITLSSLGSLTFWKIPHIEQHNAKKTNLEVFQKIKIFKPILESHRQDAIISSITFNSISPGKKPMLLMGFSDGYFDVCRLTAIESEDDDIGNYEDKETGVFEDDGDLLRLDVIQSFSVRLFETPITIVTSDNDGTHFACGSYQSNDIYILKYISTTKMSIVKRLQILDSNILMSITWSMNATYMVAFLQTGQVQLFHNEYLVNDSLQAANPYCTINIDTNITGLYHNMKHNSNIVLCQSNDESEALCSISLPEHIDGMGEKTILTHEKIDNIHGDTYVVCMDVSPNGKFLVIGYLDGSITLWHILNISQNHYTFIHKLRPHSDTILTIKFSYDSKAFISCSCDGSYFISRIDSPYKISYDIKPDISNIENVYSHNKKFIRDHDIHKNILLSEEKSKLIQKYDDSVHEIESNLSEIKKQIEEIVEENNSRDLSEQLDRHELVLDTTAEQNYLKSMEICLFDMKCNYSQTITVNELVTARVREICYDSFDAKASRIYPLSLDIEAITKNSNDNSVSQSNVGLSSPRNKGKFSQDQDNGLENCLMSFPIRKYSDEEKLCIDRMKRLRAIEIKTQKAHDLGHFEIMKGSHIIRSAWSNSTLGCDSHITWIDEAILSHTISDITTNDDKKESNASKSKSTTTKSSTSVGNEDDDDMSIESDIMDIDMKSLSIYDLLYPSLSIRSHIQKRTQMYFLKFIDMSIRQDFNLKFQLLKNEKDDAISTINTKLERIYEIYRDLGMNIQEKLSISLYPNELENYDIQMFDYELFSEKYETESMKLKRLQEEEENLKLVNESLKNDIKRRALNEMMNGVLETKRNYLSTSDTLETEKPVWLHGLMNGNDDMVINLNDLNDIQRKEYELYELKLRHLQEEKLKYKKSLEQELKKLKSEILDIMKLFNEHYYNHLSLKLGANRQLLIKELFSSLICNSIVNNDYNYRQLLSLKQEIISNNNNQKIEVSKRLKHIKQYMDELNVKIAISQDEEKALDKSFKRDIQLLCNNTTFDQETLKIFTTLHRSRQYNNISYGNDIGVLGFSETGNFSKYDDDDDMNHTSHGVSSSRNAGSKDHSNKSRTSRMSKRANNHRDSRNNNTNRVSKARLSSSKNQTNSDAKDMALGPMQEAARALKGGDKQNEIKDPYHISILYHQKLELKSLIPIPINNHLKMEIDCPDGFNVEKFEWAKLQELRSARIEKEISTKKLMNELTLLRGKYDLIKDIEGKCETDMNKMINQRNLLFNTIIDRETNLDLLIILKQGQNEVLKDILNIDYSKALLLPIFVINGFNKRIMEIGADKISILTKLKTYRRKNNLVNWETDHLDLMKKHLSDYYTDLQLLRVTKDLQQVLRDGCNPDVAKVRHDPIPTLLLSHAFVESS